MECVYCAVRTERLTIIQVTTKRHWYRFSLSTSLSPVSIIPTVLHLHLHVALTRRANGELRNLQKQCSFGIWAALNTEVLAHFY